MKHIVKNVAPDELEVWKKRKRLTKPDLQHKSRLQQEYPGIWQKFKKDREGNETRKRVKQALLEEQGFICCYCQCALEGNIFSRDTWAPALFEHFVSMFEDATLMFEYDNLLACCHGGRDRAETFEDDELLPVQPKWCENAKGKQSLTLNPCQQDCENHFQYQISDITAESLQIIIEGTTPLGVETVKKLNLNVAPLRNMRGAVVSNLLFDDYGNLISIEEGKKLLAFFEEEIKDRNNKMFRPFCLVIIHLLRQIS